MSSTPGPLNYFSARFRSFRQLSRYGSNSLDFGASFCFVRLFSRFQIPCRDCQSCCLCFASLTMMILLTLSFSTEVLTETQACYQTPSLPSVLTDVSSASSLWTCSPFFFTIFSVFVPQWCHSYVASSFSTYLNPLLYCRSQYQRRLLLLPVFVLRASPSFVSMTFLLLLCFPRYIIFICWLSVLADLPVFQRLPPTNSTTDPGCAAAATKRYSYVPLRDFPLGRARRSAAGVT